MNKVLDADGSELGYWFYCNLSKCYIAVKASGERASARDMYLAERFVRS
jgi:hypothetical protein